jgi:hypothetical protein
MFDTNIFQINTTIVLKQEYPLPKYLFMRTYELICYNVE